MNAENINNQEKVDMVALHRDSGRLIDSPLTMEGAPEWAKIAAYSDPCIFWNTNKPEQGEEMEINVKAPFCCKIGETFYAVYELMYLVRAKLLSIVSSDLYNAWIRIRVLEISDVEASVKFIPKIEQDCLSRNHYDYCVPDGVSSTTIERVSLHTVCAFHDSKDECCRRDYIYTDDNGVDHLIMSHEWSSREGILYIGDRILGFHTAWPFEAYCEALRFHCHRYGGLGDSPLTVSSYGSFRGAEIAVYSDYVHWGKVKPVCGEKIDIRVGPPVYCNIGDTVYFEYLEDYCVQAKVLAVISSDHHKATIQIEVLDIKDRMSFVGPVVADENELNHYNYHINIWGISQFRVEKIDEHTVCMFSNFGGSEYQRDYIYTDENGIDHQIMSKHSDPILSCTYVGDKVLGPHSLFPIYEENGFEMNWQQKLLLRFPRDASEIAIPEGITRVFGDAFWGCSKVERIYVPASVVYMAKYFGDCKKLKEIILSTESPFTEKDFSKYPDIKILRMPRPASSMVTAELRKPQINTYSAHWGAKNYDDWDDLNRDGRTNRKKHYISGSGTC